MPTPTPEVFFVYDDNGVPVTGASAGMSFTIYKTEAGADITPQPAITEIGAGAYKFTPATPPSGHGIVYVVNTGFQPPHYGRYFRIEDYYPDKILDIQSFLFGRWEIKTTGGDANRIIYYQPDGVTELAKFDLLDVNGAPGTINPYLRRPV
jgi:hypothetical protein